jgi:photosystem II stability/assembly factor-like uncharacterized protein
VSPPPPLQPRRAWAHPASTAVLSLLLAAAVLSSCARVTHTPRAATTRVLGEQSATAAVRGQPAPVGTGELGAVSCADATHCWAVGVVGPDDTTTTAAAAATVIAATRDGGATWSAQSTGLGAVPELDGISCPTVDDCMAVGSTGGVPGTGIVLTTRDGGLTWTQGAVPSGAFVLTGVRCASSTTCLALISDGTNIWSARTADFGHTWVQEGNLPPGFSDPRVFSCTSDGTCLVAGYSPTSTGHGQGAIALSTDGGATWAAAVVPPGLGVLQDATCPLPTDCVAVGTTSTTVSDVIPAIGELVTSSDGGHTWSLSANTPPVDDVFGIACPTAKVCVVVGTLWHGNPAIGAGAVAHSTDGGLTYTTSSTAYAPLSLTALACPSATACVAVGGDTMARITLPAPKVVPTTTSFDRLPLRLR